MKPRSIDTLEVLLGHGLRVDAAAAGIRESIARVLLALEPDDTLPMGAVALLLARDPSTTTRFVDRAAAEGFVARRAGQDRRHRLASLTPAGRDQRRRLVDLRRARVEGLVTSVREQTGLGKDQITWFVEALVASLER